MNENPLGAGALAGTNFQLIETKQQKCLTLKTYKKFIGYSF